MECFTLLFDQSRSAEKDGGMSVKAAALTAVLLSLENLLSNCWIIKAGLCHLDHFIHLLKIPVNDSCTALLNLGNIHSLI